MNKQRAGYIVSLLAIPLFLWVLVGQAIEVNLTTDKLIKVTGIVDRRVNILSKSRTSAVELRIYLKDKPDYFRIMSVYHYNRFIDLINPGDTVELYIRPKWLVILGMGHRNDIFQMTSNGETIFRIADTRKNAKGIIVVCVLAIVAFIILGQYIKKKQKTSSGS